MREGSLRLRLPSLTVGLLTHNFAAQRMNG